MRFVRVLLSLAALQLHCARAPRATRPQPTTQAPAAPTTPAPPSPAEAWSEAFNVRQGVADFAPSPDVVVHAPPGFDPSAPLHLVVVLHGMGHSALKWAGGGLIDPRTGQPAQGWGGEQRHDLAGTRTLLIAPQFDDRPGHARLGRFAAHDGFRRFLDELLSETLAPRLHGPHSLADVASVTLVGSSAGGPAIAALLDRDDLDGRVRSVVLFDSIYASEASYARWLRGGDAGPPRRLVCIHEGLTFTASHAARLLSMVRPGLGAQLAVQPGGSMTEAVRTHRAVFATVDCEHIGMGPAYLDKVLPGLDLPPREPDPDPKTPDAPAPAPTAALAWGVTVPGSLATTDPRMRDGSVFDDYALDLAAGESATVTLRGGPSAGVLCRRLDVQLRVLEGDRPVVDDDDGDGDLGSRAHFTAPHAGRYTVRAMSHGPWVNLGDYTVRVDR